MRGKWGPTFRVGGICLGAFKKLDKRPVYTIYIGERSGFECKL